MPNAFRSVAVTGASGYVGSQLIQRLERDDSVEFILATDIRVPSYELSSKGIFLNHDITRPIGDLFAYHGIEAVAHLAFMLNPGRNTELARKVNVGGAINVMNACAESSIKHLLYFSSTTVYGAHPDNQSCYTEDFPIRPIKGFQYSEAKAEVEGLLRDFKERHPKMSMCILRSCPVMGPNADNFISNAFSKPILVGIKGYDPLIQFIHEDDTAKALAHCLLNDVNGTYNIGGYGGIKWSDMARIYGRKLVKLPAPLLYGITDLSWKLRLQNESPSCGLDFIRYPWTASTEKIEKELGLNFQYSSQEAWESFANREKSVDSVEAKAI